MQLFLTLTCEGKFNRKININYISTCLILYHYKNDEYSQLNIKSIVVFVLFSGCSAVW